MSPPLVPAGTAAADTARQGRFGSVLLPEGRGELISSEQVKHGFEGNLTGGGSPVSSRPFQ